MLAGIAGLLKPTGRAVVTFPNDSLIVGAKRVLKKSGASRLRSFGGPSGGDRCHLHVWTVDEEPLMRRLLEMGVDGIQTDRPDVLARVLTEVAGRPPAPVLRRPGVAPASS